MILVNWRLLRPHRRAFPEVVLFESFLLVLGWRRVKQVLGALFVNFFEIIVFACRVALGQLCSLGSVAGQLGRFSF